jgi:hypothetical protein
LAEIQLLLKVNQLQVRLRLGYFLFIFNFYFLHFVAVYASKCFFIMVCDEFYYCSFLYLNINKWRISGLPARWN